MMKLSFQERFISYIKLKRGPGRATAAQLHSLGVLMFFLEFTVQIIFARIVAFSNVNKSSGFII